MSKKKKSKEKQIELPKAPSKTTVVDTDEKPFDFGGLPPINLKKNLGCG